MYKPLLTLTITSLCLCCFSFVRASDHLDAPALQAAGNGDRDINDLYVFQSPANANNTVLIMTVNPFAGVMSGTTFGTDVGYEFQVDNNGDAVADVTYNATFDAGQNVTLKRNGSTVVTGNAATSLPIPSGGMVQTGLFDDPFFFDLAGFQNEFMFTGDDAFAGADVSAIVLEIPSSELGGPDVGVWARTLSAGNQVDRVGRPAINTVLIPSARKDEFNQSAPDQDPADFGADVLAAITALSNATNAATLTDILLPDVLTFDTSNSAGFLNGRQLADDVIDAELNLLTAGAVTGDGVNMNDVTFRSSFPYLAPQIVPEPSGIALAFFGLAAISGYRSRSRRRRVYAAAGLVFPVAEVVRLPTPNFHGPTCGRCPGYGHF